MSHLLEDLCVVTPTALSLSTPDMIYSCDGNMILELVTVCALTSSFHRTIMHRAFGNASVIGFWGPKAMAM